MTGEATQAMGGSNATAWKGRRVFVTGATGIIGSWLVRALVARGAAVTALIIEADPGSEFVRSGVDREVGVVFGRLEDYTGLERALAVHAPDTVFHLGAQTLVEVALAVPLSTFEANIRGTYNLLEACRRTPSVQSVVVASSDKAYGESDELPYREDMPVEGRHPYDVSKSCADLIARAYFETYRLPVAVARCGNVYGGGDLNWSRIVPGTIRSLLRRQRPELRSDGTGTRDYIFVDDVVDAYLLLDEALRDSRDGVAGGAFNFSYGEALTPLDVVALLKDVTGERDVEPLVLGTATGEIAHQRLDSGKARDELGWSPSYALREGLERTVEWYREYLAA